MMLLAGPDVFTVTEPPASVAKFTARYPLNCWITVPPGWGGLRTYSWLTGQEICTVVDPQAALALGGSSTSFQPSPRADPFVAVLTSNPRPRSSPAPSSFLLATS